MKMKAEFEKMPLNKRFLIRLYVEYDRKRRVKKEPKD